LDWHPLNLDKDEIFDKSLDWFGCNYFDTSYSYGDMSGWEFHRYYVFVNQIYSHLNSNQRVVPTVLGYVEQVNDNGKRMSQQQADEYCTINAQKYLHWALEDYRVVALLPFYWKSLPPTLGYPNHWDLSMMPNCSKTWEGIGKIVSSNPSN